MTKNGGTKFCARCDGKKPNSENDGKKPKLRSYENNLQINDAH